jgi:hypothetical protein
MSLHYAPRRTLHLSISVRYVFTLGPDPGPKFVGEGYRIGPQCTTLPLTACEAHPLDDYGDASNK